MLSTNERIEILELQICDILISQDGMSASLDRLSEELDRSNAMMDEALNMLTVLHEHLEKLHIQAHSQSASFIR